MAVLGRVAEEMKVCTILNTCRVPVDSLKAGLHKHAVQGNDSLTDNVVSQLKMNTRARCWSVFISFISSFDNL